MSLVDNWNSSVYGGSTASAYGAVGGEYLDENAILEDFASLNLGHKDKSGEDTPIFYLDKVDYTPSAPIIHMTVASGVISMAMKNGAVVQIDIDHPQDLEEIKVTKKPGETIHKLFMDPSGTHLLIALSSRETLYLNSHWSRPKRPRTLAKFRGIVLHSVCWDEDTVTKQGTGEILLGANSGVIWRSLIEASGDGKAEASFFKPAYNIREDMPITGLYMERFPAEPKKIFAMATTPTRIYQFVGHRKNSLEDIFSAYESMGAGFQELPGDLAHSELCVWRSKTRRGKKFAWLTSPGVYHGDLMFGNQGSHDSVLTDATLLPYPKSQARDASSSSVNDDGAGGYAPVALHLSEFHFLLLWPSKFQAISTLNNEVVCKEEFSDLALRRQGRIRGVVHDQERDKIWAFADQCVFEVIVTNEDRHVWELFLQKGQFEEAEKHCQNAVQQDKVNSARGDYYLTRAQYSLAAQFYGKTHRSFEEVALKFIRAGQDEALKVYLTTKLDLTPERDATQLMLICTWLLELYLNRLNDMAPPLQVGRAKSIASGSGAAATLALQNPSLSVGGMLSSSSTSSSSSSQMANYRAVQEELQQFLDEHHAHLDKSTVFKLISSHGRVAELLYYATLVEDYERVIAHYLQQPPVAPHQISSYASVLASHINPALREANVGPGSEVADAIKRYMMSHLNALQALDVMGKQDNPKVFYRFCPLLMHRIPFDTVNLWIRNESILDPKELMPALLRYNPDNNPPGITENQAIRFLQICVGRYNNRDLAIHNYLLSLYAKQGGDERRLIEFLEKPERVFDLEYALRVCVKERCHQACVLIYSSMGLYEEAVEMALAGDDIETAKLQADKPEDDNELRKKLWLRIARHVVEVENNLAKAVQFVQLCDLLKIEDILPFFPDFELIDNFKHLICSSLQDYGRHIDVLKREMNDATGSANMIRDDITHLQNKYAFVSENQPCDICGFVLLSGKFYIFPCQHVFHTQCLRDAAWPLLDPVQRNSLSRLEAAIESTTLAASSAAQANETPVAEEHSEDATSSFFSFLSNAATSGDDSSSSISSDTKQKAEAAAAAAALVATNIAGGPTGVESLEEKIDDILAAECIFCGDLNIGSIDRPFIDDNEKAEIDSWSL